MASPETHLNGSLKMREWYFHTNGHQYDLFEAYLNGTIVFRKRLELWLPNPSGTSTINLRSFINANNPDGYDTILVYNTHTQPSITSGDLSGLDVTFINNGQILGTYSGYNALTLSSYLILINNGWIKGAGGRGGDGGQASDRTDTIGVWETRDSYDDGGPYSGTSSSCSPHSQLFNRFWKNGGSNSGAWSNTACTGQDYFDTNDASVWGDQGICYTIPGIVTLRKYDGELNVVNSYVRNIHAGNKGIGGAGQSYTSSAVSGTAGTAATVDGPVDGFNSSTGVNMLGNLQNYRGGNGGSGGSWGANGSDGAATLGGDPGTSGSSHGRAITNTGYLLSGSHIGNTIG